MALSPRLGMTLMATSALNKEALFNEALLVIDRMTAPAVVSATETAPPGSPAIGDTYRVPVGGTGLWSGQDHKLAIWTGAWRFVNPVPGLIIYALDTDSYWRYFAGSVSWEQADLLVTSLDSIPDVDLYGLEDNYGIRYDAGTDTWVPTPLSLPLSSIGDLPDVDLYTLQDGDVLQYDSVSGTWLPTPLTFPGLALSGLTDVNTSGVSDGDVLTYDSGSGDWIASAPATPSTSLSALTDVDLYTLVDGNVLAYDQTSGTWLPVPMAGAITALSDIPDVVTTGISDGDILVWDAGTSEWVAQAPMAASMPLDNLTDVDTYGVADQDSLVFDQTSGIWIPKTTLPTYFTVSASGDLTSAMFQGGGVVRVSSGSPVVLTVPSGLNAKHPVTIIGLGTGTVTIEEESGVTVLSADNKLNLRAQYSSAALIPDTAANTFILVGDIDT